MDEISLPRTISFLTNTTNGVPSIVPKINEYMLHYVNENRDYVSGEVIARLLFHLFKIGYEPPIDTHSIGDGTTQNPINFEEYTEIIIRDFDAMPAYSIVKASLALYFYRALPLELITRIFSIDFIERMDKEMKLNIETVRFQMTLCALPTNGAVN